MTASLVRCPACNRGLPADQLGVTDLCNYCEAHLLGEPIPETQRCLKHGVDCQAPRCVRDDGWSSLCAKHHDELGLTKDVGYSAE